MPLGVCCRACSHVILVIKVRVYNMPLLSFVGCVSRYWTWAWWASPQDSETKLSSSRSVVYCKRPNNGPFFDTPTHYFWRIFRSLYNRPPPPTLKHFCCHIWGPGLEDNLSCNFSKSYFQVADQGSTLRAVARLLRPKNMIASEIRNSLTSGRMEIWAGRLETCPYACV